MFPPLLACLAFLAFMAVLVSGNQLVFYLFAGLALVSAIGVVTVKNVMNSALCLSITLLNIAGIFVLLHAEFLAAVQVVLYAGGIMVLIVFAILLTQRLMGDQHPQTNDQWGAALAICLMLGVVMMMVIKGTTFVAAPAAASVETNVGTLGRLLLTTYLIPFEVASVVLLAAMVGVVVIAKKDTETKSS